MNLINHKLTDLQLKQLALELGHGKQALPAVLLLLIAELREARRARTHRCPAADVREFHEKFGLLVSDVPTPLTSRKLIERVECLREELGEFIEACGLTEVNVGQLYPELEDQGDAPDLAGQADALVDLVYFALGTAVMMGLPWQALWDDVQRANMAKVRGIGHRGHAADCVKPPGWEPPRTQALLAEAGYDQDTQPIDDVPLAAFEAGQRRAEDEEVEP